MKRRNRDDELCRFLLSLRADFPLIFPGWSRADAEAEAARKCSPDDKEGFRNALGAILLTAYHVWPAEHGRDSEKERQILTGRNHETGKKKTQTEVLDRLQIRAQERGGTGVLAHGPHGPVSDGLVFHSNEGVRVFSRVPRSKRGLVERLFLLYLRDDTLGTSVRARRARLLRVRLMLLDAGVRRDPPDSWADIARDFGTSEPLAKRALRTFKEKLPAYLRETEPLSAHPVRPRFVYRKEDFDKDGDAVLITGPTADWVTDYVSLRLQQLVPETCEPMPAAEAGEGPCLPGTNIRCTEEVMHRLGRIPIPFVRQRT